MVGRAGVLQYPCRFESVDARHADVHEHDVGPDIAGQLHRLVPVRGLAHDLKLVGGVDEGLEASNA